MGRPSEAGSDLSIDNGRGFSLRVVRLGRAPLVEVWVGEEGRGWRGIILDVESATDLIETLNDLLDEIEVDVESEAG